MGPSARAVVQFVVLMAVLGGGPILLIEHRARSLATRLSVGMDWDSTARIIDADSEWGAILLRGSSPRCGFVMRHEDLLTLVEDLGPSSGPSKEHPLLDLRDGTMRSTVASCPSLAVEFDTFSMGHAFLTIELEKDGRIKSIMPPVIHD